MEYLGIIEYRFLTDLRDANSEAFCCSHAGLFGGYGKKEYDEKRIGKILIFESYTIPQRIGSRGVQSEQIQAHSSFFRAVTKFFNI